MIARGRPICLDYIRIEPREGEKRETVCVCGRELTCRLRPTRAEGDATLHALPELRRCDTTASAAATSPLPGQVDARWDSLGGFPPSVRRSVHATFPSECQRRAFTISATRSAPLVDQRGSVTMTTAEAVCDNSRRSSAAFRERRLGDRFQTFTDDLVSM